MDFFPASHKSHWLEEEGVTHHDRHVFCPSSDKKTNNLLQPTEGITNVKVGYINGVQVCRFTRQKLVTGRTDKIFDLNNPYYLLIADGATFGSSEYP